MTGLEAAVLFVVIDDGVDVPPSWRARSFSRFSTKPRNIQSRVWTQNTAKVPTSRPVIPMKV